MFVAAEVLYGGQAFFERCIPFLLRQCSTIKAASSYQPPEAQKLAALKVKAAVWNVFGHEKWLPSSGFFSFLPLGRCNQHYVVGNIYCASEWKEPAYPVRWFHRKAGSAFYVWLICLRSFSVAQYRPGLLFCILGSTAGSCEPLYLRRLWFGFYFRKLGKKSTLPFWQA